MLTSAALRSLPGPDSVVHRQLLLRSGWSDSAIRGQLAAHRWQRFGRAIVLHNATLTTPEKNEIALLNAGPRAAPTAFTSLTEWGLVGWERAVTHLVVAAGSRVVKPPGVPVRVHWTDDWARIDVHPVRRLHRPAPSAVVAAATMAGPRPACGILAAVVQQRLTTPRRLLEALERAPRTRHRATLLPAAQDIGQGAQALSEIDLGRLCRRHGLPMPVRQAVRVEPSGRRRYLDGEWVRANGQRVVVEVDGALHLVATRWWDDQLRQNELVIAGDRVLRFPSVVVRCEEALVADQLRRLLFG